MYMVITCYCAVKIGENCSVWFGLDALRQVSITLGVVFVPTLEPLCCSKLIVFCTLLHKTCIANLSCYRVCKHYFKFLPVTYSSCTFHDV